MKIPAISELILKNIKKDSYRKYIELIPDIKSDQNEKLLTIILTIMASIILGIFAINPTLSTIASLNKQLDDNRFVEEKLQEKINNLSSLDQKYQAIKNDLPVIYNAIPDTAQIATLTAALQQISGSSNVQLVDLESLQIQLSKEAQANKKFSTYQFIILSKGNYQDLITLLDKLINFQRIITIDDISILKETDLNETFLLFNLKGTVYFKK